MINEYWRVRMGRFTVYNYELEEALKMMAGINYWRGKLGYVFR